jgi:hypothetical protein
MADKIKKFNVIVDASLNSIKRIDLGIITEDVNERSEACFNL